MLPWPEGDDKNENEIQELEDEAEEDIEELRKRVMAQREAFLAQGGAEEESEEESEEDEEEDEEEDIHS